MVFDQLSKLKSVWILRVRGTSLCGRPAGSYKSTLIYLLTKYSKSYSTLMQAACQFVHVTNFRVHEENMVLIFEPYLLNFWRHPRNLHFTTKFLRVLCPGIDALTGQLQSHLQSQAFFLRPYLGPASLLANKRPLLCTSTSVTLDLPLSLPAAITDAGQWQLHWHLHRSFLPPYLSPASLPVNNRPLLCTSTCGPSFWALAVTTINTRSTVTTGSLKTILVHAVALMAIIYKILHAWSQFDTTFWTKANRRWL